MNTKAFRYISFAVAFVMALGTSFPALASPAGSTQALGHHAPLLSSNVYYVSTTGSDTNSGSGTSPFKTFAKAISVLTPGDTLQVMAGTYTEPLLVSVSGTSTAPITVIGNKAKVDVKSAKNTAIRISGSYINLSGFEATGATDAGIAISGKYVTVKNNILHNNVTKNGNGTCGTSTTGWSSALKVGVGGQNLLIDGNTSYNNCGEGIAITRGVNVMVQNNTAYDNWSQNIYVDNSPYTTVQNNTVYCTGAVLRPDGKRPSGVGLGEEYYSGWGAQMHDVLVTSNTIKDCGKGIGAYSSEVNGTFTNITITKNYVPSGQLRPIILTTSPNKNVLISYNTIYTDAYVSDKNGVTLTGNIVGDNNTAPTATPTATKPPVTAGATNTPVPTFTSTPVTVASPTPTSVSQATPTPTTVTNPSTSDEIFQDGFESGTISTWTSSATNGGALSVSTGAALSGSYGLQAQINSTTAMYVNDASPNAEPHYRARFYFDPNTISMGSGNYMYLLQGNSGTGTAQVIVLRVELKYNNGVYQVRAKTVDSSSTWLNTPYVTVSDAPHYLEVEWAVASSAGATDGYLNFWVDGIPQGSVTGIANDAYRLESVRLGITYLSGTATTGTIYLDNFQSRRQTYIGP